jgi:hypothetical protein
MRTAAVGVLDTTRSAPITPVRGPSGWDEGIEPLPDWDEMTQPEPEYQFAQPVDW